MNQALPAIAAQHDNGATAQDDALAVHDLIDQLLREHKGRLADIDQLAAIMDGGLRNAVHYYIEGNAGKDQFHRSLYLDKLFRKPRAYLALQEESWNRALVETGLMEFLPQARREQWRESLSAWRTKEGPNVPLPPPFEEETVRPLIASLLDQRLGYLAEGVDGVFASLSRSYYVNCPEGFFKRMIMNRVFSEHGSVDHHAAGVVNDLRAVVAKFMGRDEPKWEISIAALGQVRDAPGWVVLDGGALKLRAYKVGTLHIEVHPAMAERLNKVLAAKHPLAIPKEFRRAASTKNKDTTGLERPQLSFAAAKLLHFATIDRHAFTVRISDIHQIGAAAVANAAACLIRLGGRPTPNDPDRFAFDSDPAALIANLVLTGCVPLPAAER